MTTHATAGPEAPAERRFDGPWLRVLAVSVAGWTLLYGLDRLLLTPETGAAAAASFGYTYLLAPLATAAVLLDALSLGERGVAAFGVFKWVYALTALVAPPIGVAYYAHREWLKPDDASLLEP